MASMPAFQAGGTGSNPVYCSICGDSSIGRMSVSKTEDMGSNPTAVPIHRLVLGRGTFEVWSNEVK